MLRSDVSTFDIGGDGVMSRLPDQAPTTRRAALPQTRDSPAAGLPELLAAFESRKCVGHTLRSRLFALG